MPTSDDAAVNTRELLREYLAEAGRGASAKLAQDLDVSRQTISGWSSGALPIHPRWYIRLAEALQVDHDDFINAGGKADLVEGLDYLEVLHRWNMLYPGSVDDPLPARVEERNEPAADDAFADLDVAASGVDLQKLRRADPDAYDEIMRLAREALDRANERDA